MSDTSSLSNSANGENASTLARIKKPATTFLLTTYHMLEDKENSAVIRWQNDGNSFVISSIEEFVKILPRYFKTKNYSSFVRQLNLYNFHKIKNQEGLIEFGHEQFRRGAIENLQFITRKINQDSDSNRQKMKSQKPLSFEYNRLLGIIRNLENSLRVANSKNENLQNENLRLTRQYEEDRQKQDERNRVLLYVIWILTTNFHQDINFQILQIYRNFGVQYDASVIHQNGVAGLRQILEESRLLKADKCDELLNALLQFAVNLHNSQPANWNNKISVLSAYRNDNNFMMGSPMGEPALFRGNSCATSDLFQRSLSPYKRSSSIEKYCHEEPLHDDNFDRPSMEVETESHTTGVSSRHFRNEPENIFPEQVFCFGSMKAEKVPS